MDSQPSPPPETVTVNFSVGIGDGKFAATVEVPAGQTNLTQILPVLRSLNDSMIAGVSAQLEQAGHGISCRAGCGSCCRQMVPLSIFEAEALAEILTPDLRFETTRPA